MRLITDELHEYVHTFDTLVRLKITENKTLQSAIYCSMIYHEHRESVHGWRARNYAASRAYKLI